MAGTDDKGIPDPGEIWDRLRRYMNAVMPKVGDNMTSGVASATARASAAFIELQRAIDELQAQPRAAVSYIERPDGKLLCVWNRRYWGWSLPGGKVEPGESVEDAQARKLQEETGLDTMAAEEVYAGEHGLSVESSRGSVVHLFHVIANGTPREMEPGCPILWMTREEFLRCSPMASFYEKVFAVFPRPRPASAPANIGACPSCGLWWFDTMLHMCGSCGSRGEKVAPPLAAKKPKLGVVEPPQRSFTAWFGALTVEERNILLNALRAGNQTVGGQWGTLMNELRHRLAEEDRRLSSPSLQ